MVLLLKEVRLPSVSAMLIVIVALLLLSLPIHSTADEWKPIGPGGQTISSMTLIPKNPSTVFAVISGAKQNTAILARSTNSGHAWMKTPLIKDVTQVVVHPRTSEVFVVIVIDDTPVAELWVSSDRGKSFQFRTRMENYSGQLRIDSARPNRFYRVGYSDVFKSENGGRTWLSMRLPQKVQNCDVRRWFVSDLAAVEGELLITGMVELSQCSIGRFINVLMRSKDQGRTWKYLDTLPFFQSDPLSSGFKIESSSPDRIYFYGSKGVAVLSSDEAKLLSEVPLDSLSVFPNNSEKLIGIGLRLDTGKVLVSNDGGITWIEDLDNLSFSIRSLQPLDDGAGGILAGTASGLFYKNENHKWQLQNKGLPKAAPYQIDSLSQSGTRLYTLVWDNFLYRKDGPNKPWQNLFANYSLSREDRLVRVAANPKDPNHVILLGSSPHGYEPVPILISNDGGIHWQRSTIELREPRLSFDPTDLKVVYFYDDFGIYKSIDRGFNATQIGNLRNVTQLLVDPNNSQTLFAIASWFYKSVDGGLTFTKLAAPPDRRAASIIIALPNRNSFLLGTRYGSVFRTEDGGESWQFLSRVNLQPDPEGECNRDCFLAGLYAASNTYYFSITGAGWFYESRNAGKTWILKQTNLVSDYGQVYLMADPRTEPFYIATTRGVYQHNP